MSNVHTRALVHRPSIVRGLALAAALLVADLGSVAAQGAKTQSKAQESYKVAIHVADNDQAKMTLALNNVQNIIADFKKAGRKIDIEVVTYGPGLHMFREDTSPVKARIQEMALANQNLTFAGCANTQGNMSKAEKKDITLLSEVKVVPSGIVHLIELQRRGYAYVRP